MNLNFLERIRSSVSPQNRTGLPFSPAKDDVFLVSYPRSGNTWLRFLIGNYLSTQNLDFFSVHTFMPDMHEHPELVDQLTHRPRFIKSHFAHHPDMRKVIYLVRNGRDVAVSYYHFHRRTKQVTESCTFKEFFECFNSGKVAYGSWDNHVQSWLDNSPDRFLLVRYEDLKANPVGELIRMCIFAKIPVDLPRIKQVVEQSSFEKMAQLDASQPRRGIVPKDKDQMFVREGGSNYDDYFDEAMNVAFLQRHGAAMKRLGYI